LSSCLAPEEHGVVAAGVEADVLHIFLENQERKAVVNPTVSADSAGAPRSRLPPGAVPRPPPPRPRSWHQSRLGVPTKSDHMPLTLTLKTAPTKDVYEIELESDGTVADLVRQAEVVHGLRIKTVIFRGSVLANEVLVEAGLTNWSTLVILLHTDAAAPTQARELEPSAPRSECVGPEELVATVPLCAWMGQLPTSVLESRSLCELALPCAHNAGARSVLCVPRRALAKFVGHGMAGMPFVEQIARPIASAAAVCQTLTISELLAAGVRGLDLRVGMH